MTPVPSQMAKTAPKKISIDTDSLATPGTYPGVDVWVFRAPDLSQLIVLANRLFRFRFPPERNLETMQRFIHQQLHEPRLSKKEVEALPLRLLESLTVKLWTAALSLELESEDKNSALDDEWNQVLTGAFFLEEILQFAPVAMAHADIAQLGATADGQLHGYYFSDAPNHKTYEQLLKTFHCRSDWMSTAKISPPIASLFFDEERQAISYLLCRSLSAVFPWRTFLEALAESLPPDELKKHEMLYRGVCLARVLQKKIKNLPLDPLGKPEFLEIIMRILEESAPELSEKAGCIRPTRLLVLAEGPTEELLLPMFAKTMGIHFQREGIQVQSCGGKSQMKQTYLKYAEALKGPIFMLLDQDASDIASEIRKELRKGDYIRVLEAGEFEDAYDPPLVIRTVNRCYEPYPRLTEKRYRTLIEEHSEHHEPDGHVAEFQILWRALGLGMFDKIEFAEKIYEVLNKGLRNYLPSETMQKLIRDIVALKNEKLAN